MKNITNEKIEEVNKEIEIIKDNIFDLDNKISNTKYDLKVAMKDCFEVNNKLNDFEKQRNNFIQQKNKLNKELENEKEKMKDEYLENRKRFFSKLQEKSLPAKRCNEKYIKGEIIEIIKMEKYSWKIRGRKILYLALKFNRTWYGIEHTIRSRDFYLKYGRFEKKSQGKKIKGIYVEPTSNLLEECIKEVYNLK